MLKEELREVMEDANEMADLIREYEQREEERLAVRSAKKELQEERERVYGNGTVPSPRSSDASSKRLMRFEEIKEKVRRQHEDAQRYKQNNRSGGTSPTASDMSSQFVEEDNAPKYTRSASKRITEAKEKCCFEFGLYITLQGYNNSYCICYQLLYYSTRTAKARRRCLFATTPLLFQTSRVNSHPRTPSPLCRAPTSIRPIDAWRER